MGRRGPTPVPDNVRALRGTLEDRPAEKRDREKPPPASSLAPPRGISKDGRAAWNALAPYLHRQGLLSEGDKMALFMACEDYSIAMAALRELKSAGGKLNVVVVDKGHQGRLSRHPATFVYRHHAGAFGKWAREFGLTPAARAALELGPPLPGAEDDDEDDEDLFGSPS